MIDVSEKRHIVHAHDTNTHGGKHVGNTHPHIMGVFRTLRNMVLYIS